jgi:hypothetical protein
MPKDSGDWLAVIFAIAFVTGFGWSWFDGRKRRSPKYRARLADSIEKMPPASQERFRVLFFPRSIGQRVTQAVIIGLCSAIVLVLAPVWAFVGWGFAGRPAFSLALIIAGGVLGAMACEFTSNNRAAKS